MTKLRNSPLYWLPLLLMGCGQGVHADDDNLTKAAEQQTEALLREANAVAASEAAQSEAGARDSAEEGANAGIANSY